MSAVNHQKRLEGVVNSALLQASFTEPFGYAVNGPGHWPILNEEGRAVGAGPAWFVLVTIRDGVGQPDLGHGWPVAGVLPPDSDFFAVAQALLERCRRERDEKNKQAMAAAKVGLSAAMNGRGK